MIVVDTSAIIAAIAGDPRLPALVERMSADGDLHAPHLLDVEALDVLRGLVLAGKLSPRRAAAAREDLQDLRITRYPHEPLSDRIWELRANLTTYDAAFIALAEALGVPLVTCDTDLSRVPGTRAHVELFTTP